LIAILQAIASGFVTWGATIGRMIVTGFLTWGTVLGGLMGIVVSVLFFPTWTILLFIVIGGLLGAFTHELVR
jgi:uncharacterized membrane protein YccC